MTQKRIVCFDTETTGTDVEKDRIVEIAFRVAFPDEQPVTEYAGYERTYRFNPGVPIPTEASEVHGIFDKDVAHEQPFKEKAKSIQELFNGAVLMGYNIKRFDIPLLQNELLRCGLFLDMSTITVLDIQDIYHKHFTRKLTDAARVYCNVTDFGAHRALNDVQATWGVFQAQKLVHGLTDRSIEEISEAYCGKMIDARGKFCYNKEGLVSLAFGKHKDKPLSKVEADYWTWAKKEGVFIKTDWDLIEKERAAK